MSRSLVITTSAGEMRAAEVEDGQVVALHIRRAHRGPFLGDRFTARIETVEGHLSGAFADLGSGGPAFLPLRRRDGDIVSGALVPVTVVRAAAAGKPPKLARIEGGAPGPAAGPCGPARAPFAQEVAAMLAAGGTVRVDDAALARDLGAVAAPGQLVHDPDCWHALRVDAVIEGALLPEVPLSGGGRLTIEATRALTAIDVDSGDSGRRPAALNRVAVVEAARQLRLRGIGGIVVIDLIDMGSPADRRAVESALAARLARDPAETMALPVSRLGLLEMTRARIGPSLAELFRDPADGRRWNAESRALEALRQIEEGVGGLATPYAQADVPADVADWLEQRPDLLASFARRVTPKIHLRRRAESEGTSGGMAGVRGLSHPPA